MFKSSKQHLIDSQCSYYEHFKFAIYAGGLLAWAAIASIIHAVIPGILKGTAAFTVIKFDADELRIRCREL